MSEICNYCEVDFDYHDHSHLACECLPKQIQLLEANLARCREERDALKAELAIMFPPLPTLPVEVFNEIKSLQKQNAAYKEALESRNMTLSEIRDLVEHSIKHNDIQSLRGVLFAIEALTPVQSPDAREKETR